MTDMPVRVRNRLQDGVISWQEFRSRNAEQRQQHADIKRSRMTCSAELPAYRQTQDWTESLGLSASNRLPVVEERPVRVPLISGDGIRWNAAVAVLTVVGVILLALVLADLSGLGITGQSIVRLNNKIAAVENRNETLARELEISTGSAAVCTEAVKLDLISSNGARTVRLTAPRNARLVLTSASAAAENADLEARMMSYAGD